MNEVPLVFFFGGFFTVSGSELKAKSV